ncbi:MAG: Uncharacterised protein [Prochlorococcus marinus str. MIT 9215]|nr:MAG: Uncharacterised protein [Prochlorococcus marinus str. MIT 9215]
MVFLVTRKAAIKAFSKTYELPLAQDIHKQEQEWPQLSRIRRAEEARRKQQEADEALKYAGTPDKPYVQELTAEEHAQKEWLEATRLRAGLKADGSKPDWIGKSAPSDNKPIEKRGPRGGRYTEDRTKDGRPYRRYF